MIINFNMIEEILTFHGCIEVWVITDGILHGGVVECVFSHSLTVVVFVIVAVASTVHTATVCINIVGVPIGVRWVTIGGTEPTGSPPGLREVIGVGTPTQNLTCSSDSEVDLVIWVRAEN